MTQSREQVCTSLAELIDFQQRALGMVGAGHGANPLWFRGQPIRTDALSHDLLLQRVPEFLRASEARVEGACFSSLRGAVRCDWRVDRRHDTIEATAYPGALRY